ncbi:HTH_Tnp_Tc3_2 domain-containing protein [Trichonephila clavipes]|nr:HTH_Tnp_Tc3_2 domain-containing protein [Trichonephila clavipes]
MLLNVTTINAQIILLSSQKSVGQIVVYRNFCLSYHIIVARIGRNPMTVSRILNQWVQDGNKERRAGSQRPSITSSREDRHVTRRALMNRATTSRALSREFAIQQVSA